MSNTQAVMMCLEGPSDWCTGSMCFRGLWGMFPKKFGLRMLIWDQNFSKMFFFLFLAAGYATVCKRGYNSINQKKLCLGVMTND